MGAFETYGDRYHCLAMEYGSDGILEVRLHTAGGPFQWTHREGSRPSAGEELADAFGRIAADPDVRVVILTGTGDTFSGPRASPSRPRAATPAAWEGTQRTGLELLWNLLSIDAPVISCVNGPALRHIEIPLLGDIVLASEDATFQDSAHFVSGTVPGDGVNLVMPLLMGPTRARYFLLTGQTLTATEAHALGLVNEVHDRSGLLPRARELAGQLSTQDPLILKYTRRLLVQPIRELLVRQLGFGLALEGLGAIQRSTSRDPTADPG
jgi:enoyl-CoA hydratase/carnithine racemase